MTLYREEIQQGNWVPKVKSGRKSLSNSKVLVLQKADKPASGMSSVMRRRVPKLKDKKETTPVKTEVHKDKVMEIA